MPNWRSIPPEAWEQVFEALVLFFRHRGFLHPQDEAQNTILAILKRDDYEFEKIEDIQLIAKGFARKILFEAHRRVTRYPGIPLDPVEPFLAAPANSPGSPDAIVARIYLEEVCRVAAGNLQQKELDAIKKAVANEHEGKAETLKEGNKRRVILYRSRQKLGRFIRGVIPDE